MFDMAPLVSFLLICVIILAVYINTAKMITVQFV